MNAARKLIVATMALSVTLASAALVVSPVVFAHRAQAASSQAATNSGTHNSPFAFTRIFGR